MENHQENMSETKEKKLTYKEKRREEAKEKRHKDQMSVTIFGIVIYSIVLIGIVVLSYVGFKTAINSYKERQAIQLEEERLAKEAEEKAIKEEERRKAEEEKAALEKQKAEALEKEKEKEENKFKDTVFSVIENISDPGNALVNSFDFSRKSLDDESGALMDYEVYTNPETKEIAKVTTRENCGDLFEITDYYFDNKQINYIAQYRADTDVPVDISSDKIESRFYFGNDKMLKYIYCESGKATEYSADDFKIYSEGTIEQYKYMENMMLENSKTVLKNATEIKESVKISGYVQDELNCVAPGDVLVQLVDSSDRIVGETYANGDGYYEFFIAPKDDTEYSINVKGREDLVETSVYGIKPSIGAKSITVDTVYLAYSTYDTVYATTIFVKDADDSNVALSGADVKFRYGINNRDGEPCLVGMLGDAGEIMPTLRSGCYTVEISKEGYETCYTTFVVKADHTAMLAYSVKQLKEGDIKCVLSYETTPLDIDVKAFDTFGRTVYKSANDSVGITAAETILVSDVDSGTYSFFVSDYTDIVGNDMMTYRLSESFAKMYVYDSEGLKEVFSVPAAHAGIVWRPFEIRNHKIITINDYYAYITEESVFRGK